MSYSYYRGKVYTNGEIKGPFTEAKDDFGEAFDLLSEAAALEGPDLKLEALSWNGVITISFGDLWLAIDREGMVEVGEGAA
jgi:hypothetical protein